MAKGKDSASIANERQELREIAITDTQAAVIRAVVAGASQKAAAVAVGVSEFTVSRWANSDPAYIAALNLERLFAWETQRAELAKLLSKAREALEYVLSGNDPGAMVRAAVVVLEQFASPPDGPVTVEDAELELQARHKQRWQAEQNATITMADIYAEALLNV
jgi:ABC-type xylose transport system substrate-binding protein